MTEKKEIPIGIKLSIIQTKLNAPKEQFNKFGNYKYRSCEDILEAVKPLLGECFLTLNDELVQIGDRYYVKAIATLNDGNGQIVTTAYAREPEARKGMDVAQVTGASGSYARKYALNGLFAIDDAKEIDSGKNGNDKPIDKTMEIVDEAFVQFQAVNLAYLEENPNARVSKDKFIKAIQKMFKALPTKKESIPKIVENLKLSDVLDNDFDAHIAKEEDANAPSQGDN